MDDAAFTSLHNTKLMIFSLHGELCTSLSSLDSRLLSFAIPDHRLVEGITLRQLLEPWKWSWQQAFQNRYPTLDYNGKRIPEAQGHAQDMPGR
eukprot:9545998-Alexandrium_andersonii.AAC.1